MTLEDQVTSLELSGRLADLGVKQKSQWYWVEYEYHVWDLFFKCPNEELWFDPEKQGLYCLEVQRTHSAFTVAELGSMLPKGYTTDKQDKEWFPFLVGKSVHFSGDSEPLKIDGESLITMSTMPSEKTEANVRAKMLIYLLENKLI